MHLFSRLGSMTRRASWASAATAIAAQTTRQSVVVYATDCAITSASATSVGDGNSLDSASSSKRSSTNESKFANHRERERAEPLYQEALDAYEKAYGREHRDVATALNNLGRLYHAQGLYAKAEPLYQDAPAIDTKMLPPNQPGGFATDLNSLGVLAPKQWRIAAQMHLNALSIRKTSHPCVHPKVAISLYHLGTVYEARGKYSKAESLLRQALGTVQQTLGPDSPTLGKASEKHSKIVKMLDKQAQAKTRRGRTKPAVATSGGRQ